MKHLKKFENIDNILGLGPEALRIKFNIEREAKNKEMYDYIDEVSVDIRERFPKHKVQNSYNYTNIRFATPKKLTEDRYISIKDTISDYQKTLDLIKELEDLVDKVCLNEEITHSIYVDDNNRVIDLVFEWEEL